MEEKQSTSRREGAINLNLSPALPRPLLLRLSVASAAPAPTRAMAQERGGGYTRPRRAAAAASIAAAAAPTCCGARPQRQPGKAAVPPRSSPLSLSTSPPGATRPPETDTVTKRSGLNDP